MFFTLNGCTAKFWLFSRSLDEMITLYGIDLWMRIVIQPPLSLSMCS